MAYLQEEIITNISDAEAASPTMVFANAKGTKTRDKAQAKSQRRNRIPTLTTEDLRGDEKLLGWFKAATSQKHPVLRDTYTDKLNVFAAAERALEVADDPPALFAYIVGSKQWELISCAQEDRAQQRLRRLRNPEREAKRREHRETDAITEPRSVGDVILETLKLLFPCPTLKKLDANHA